MSITLRECECVPLARIHCDDFVHNYEIFVTYTNRTRYSLVCSLVLFTCVDYLMLRSRLSNILLPSTIFTTKFSVSGLFRSDKHWPF